MFTQAMLGTDVKPDYQTENLYKVWLQTHRKDAPESKAASGCAVNDETLNRIAELEKRVENSSGGGGGNGSSSAVDATAPKLPPVTTARSPRVRSPGGRERYIQIENRLDELLESADEQVGGDGGKSAGFVYDSLLSLSFCLKRSK